MGNKKNKKGVKSFDEDEKENLKLSGIGSWYPDKKCVNVCDNSCDKHSASFHKLNEHIQQSSSLDTNSTVPAADNYIINVSCLQGNLESMTVCSVCKDGVLIIKEDRLQRKGLVPCLYVTCSKDTCGVSREFPVQPKSGRVFEINKRAVLGARVSGGGETATAKMFAFMGLPPPPSAKSWNFHQSEIADDIEVVTEDDMIRATSELIRLKRNLGECDVSDTCIDVAMSFDGTWNHVGHSATFCVVFAISIDTGKILDYEYKYKLCKMCKTMESKKESPEYEEWKVKHRKVCTKTHDGSSSSMEASCILDLYRRSIEKRGLRYTTFVGDGDSSSYRRVMKECVYGSDVSVTKENCIGHIQKRMGTKLRRLIQENKGRKLEDGKCLSGRGRLTQKVIDSFQVFYGKALRRNKGDVEGMQRATRAILMHYSASPENSSHDLCPEGKDSWCKFQVDKLLGTDTYRYPATPLPEVVCKEVTPIISELSSENLLKTCQMGLTQNTNEACHSTLWKLVSKKQYNSESAYRLATALTVGNWNSGQESFNNAVCKKLGLTVSDAAVLTWKRFDKKRLLDGEYSQQTERKQRRKDLRKETMKKEDAFQKAEGNAYQSGKYVTGDIKDGVRRCKKCKNPMKGHKRNSC